MAAARLAAHPPAPAGPLPPRRRRARARDARCELDGYRGSRPVRVGNAAAAQPQLDIYGDLLQTALALHARPAGALDRETGRRLAEHRRLVCQIWRQPDAGIWEVRSEPLHFTHSKMMCWVALDRAARALATPASSRRPRSRRGGESSARSASSSRPAAGPSELGSYTR